MNADSLTIISHPTFDVVVTCRAKYEGAKADPLHDPSNLDPQRLLANRHPSTDPRQLLANLSGDDTLSPDGCASNDDSWMLTGGVTN